METETQTTESPARPNFFALLWGLIRRPRATFTTLRDTPGRSWLLMGLIVLLLGLVLVWVAAPVTAQLAREAMQASFEAQAERNPQLADPEIQAQAVAMAANPLITVVVPSVTVFFGALIGWLVWSGALHLVGVMTGGKNSFLQMLHVVIWSSLPLAIRSLIQTVYVLATGEVIANQGLSGLLADELTVTELVAQPPGPGRLALQAFLSSIDIFQIWNLVLIAIGVMVMARVSGRKAALITLAVWLVFTLVRVAFAALPGLFVAGMG